MFNFLPKNFPLIFWKIKIKSHYKKMLSAWKISFLAQSSRVEIKKIPPILRQQTDRINIQFLRQIERKFKHFFVKLKS